MQKRIYYIIYLMLKWVKGPITRTGNEWGGGAKILLCIILRFLLSEMRGPPLLLTFLSVYLTD